MSAITIWNNESRVPREKYIPVEGTTQGRETRRNGEDVRRRVMGKIYPLNDRVEKEDGIYLGSRRKRQCRESRSPLSRLI